MAELKSIYNSGQMPDIGWIRAAEEDRSGFSWVVQSNDERLANGRFGSSYKANAANVVCVAN